MNEQINENVDYETGEVIADTAEIALAQAGTQLVADLGAQSAVAIECYGFDATTDEGAMRVFNVESDAQSLAESKLSKIEIVGINIRPGVRVDPVTGSRTACAVTTLMAADGSNYVTQSNGIARDAARLAKFLAARGWDAGKTYTVEVKETKLNGGRTLKKLALV